LVASRIWSIWEVMRPSTRRSRFSSVQHLGAAEDDASGFFRSCATVPKNLILEAIGALQPQPLRRQPSVGLHQRAGALGDAVLELGVGLVQLPIKNDIVERDRQPAAENLDQRTIGFDNCRSACSSTRPRGRCPADVEHGARIGEFVLAALEGGFDHRAQIWIERARAGGAMKRCSSRAGQHRKILIAALPSSRSTNMPRNRH